MAEYTNQSKHTFDLFILQTKSFNRRSRLSMPVRVDKDSGRFTTVPPISVSGHVPYLEQVVSNCNWGTDTDRVTTH